MNNNYKDLLAKASSGVLSKDEIEYVANELKSPIPNSDKYKLLHTLGNAHATEYTDLVESFLQYPSYPMLSALALGILCRKWDKERHYLKYLLQFLQGVPWDDQEDCLRTAINLSGRYLRRNSSVELLQELMRIFDHYTQDMIAIQNEYGRHEMAYLALKNNAHDARYIYEEYIKLPREEAIRRAELFDRYAQGMLMIETTYDAFKDALRYNVSELISKRFYLDELEYDEVVKRIRERLLHEPPAS